MLNLIMQAQPGAGGAAMGQFVFLGLMLLVFYMLLIRPQSQRMKKHRALLESIQRGDVVVTNGGLIGKVTKAADGELTVDLGEGTKVKVVRTMIADVRNRTEPANDRTEKSKSKAKAKSKDKA